MPIYTPVADFRIGVTFAPFDQAEWDHFTWEPIWRVEQDQWADLELRSVPRLLLVKLMDDASITALLPFVTQPNVWGVELGNEPDFKQIRPGDLNAWYKRVIPTIRNTGYGGLILTAGIANLNLDTLNDTYVSLMGLWPDILCGWHLYGATLDDIHRLQNMLNGRSHCMTEYGISASEGSEALVAARVEASIAMVKASGSLAYFDYQMHDGPPNTPDNDKGLHAWDGHWRMREEILKAAA